MEPREAVLTILREEGARLHWTKIQDLALRRGYLDPFEHPGVRREVQIALQELVREGLVVKEAKGVYGVAARADGED